MAEQNDQNGGTAVERIGSVNPIVDVAANMGRAASEELAERKSIDDMISWAERERDKNKPETAADVAKRKRRERTGRIVAGATDMARALSNLFFTTQYAPDMYKGSTSASKHLQEIYDREKAERAAKDDLFFRYAMMAKGLRDGERKRRQDLEDRGRRLVMEDEAAERAEQAAQFEEELNPIRKETAIAQRDKAKADARTAEVGAEWAEDYQKSRVNKNNSSGSRGRGGKTWSLRTTAGVLTYNTKEEYYAGIMEWAAKYELPDTWTRNTPKGGREEEVRYEELAGDIANETERRQKEAPKPVVRKKRKPNPMRPNGEE